MQPLEISIQSPHQLLSPDEARLVLNLICNVYPDLAPEKYDWYEPVRKHFDPRRIDNIISHWKNIFLWVRTYPRMEGSVFAANSPPTMHGMIGITMDAEKADVTGLTRFLCKAAERLDAHFAFIHLLTQPEIDRGGAGTTIGLIDPNTNTYSLCVPSWALAKWLPDLYWATVFGTPYVDLFGREHLLAAPAPVVRELEGGSIYLQLSESPLDLEYDFARVDAVRAQVKAHLNHNAFYNASLPYNYRYNVPTFQYIPSPPLDIVETRLAQRNHDDDNLEFDFGEPP